MQDMDALAANYIKLRDAKAELVAAHKAQVAEYDNVLSEIENQFLSQLQAQGATNMRTKSGTIYQAEQFSATVDDFDALLTFIRSQNAWAMLTKRVSKDAVQQWLADTGQLPPGVKVNRQLTINVRRN